MSKTIIFRSFPWTRALLGMLFFFFLRGQNPEWMLWLSWKQVEVLPTFWWRSARFRALLITLITNIISFVWKQASQKKNFKIFYWTLVKQCKSLWNTQCRKNFNCFICASYDISRSEKIRQCDVGLMTTIFKQNPVLA